jgi:hypothetical protein
MPRLHSRCVVLVMSRLVMMPCAGTIPDQLTPRRIDAALGSMSRAIACLCLTASLASAQNSTTDQPGKAEAPPPAAAPAPSDSFKPGFIDAFGRFIDGSAAKLQSQLNSQLGGARDAFEGLGRQTGDAAKNAVENAGKAVDAAKDAAGQAVALPSGRFADGRERCATAANGAPDCLAAATAICRAKGFAGGRLVDTQIVKKCPASVWLSGHIPGDSECPTETFATRAACQ